MASPSTPPSVSVVSSSNFASLRLGRTGQSIVGRLFRFWDSFNVKKGGEFMGITIMLLDELDSAIHGFIPANLASLYRSDLKLGSIVNLERFEVSKCPHKYKITEHQFVVRFIPATRLSEVCVGAPVIKSEKFMVRNFNALQILANTNLELPDVVGEIRSVQGSDLRNSSVNERIVIRLLVDQNVNVYVSLWDVAAATFRGILAAGDKSLCVVLVTTLNPKLFGGNLYLNSTSGTRFFFNPELAEISSFTRRLGNGLSQDYSCVDTLKSVEKKEVVSISELNSYIGNSHEQSQEADFICKARVVGVVKEKGWSFFACTACNKKLERSGNSFNCNWCDSSDGTGVVRYRVELAVEDGKDNATFVVFDKEMKKLIQQEAAAIALENGMGGMEEDFLACLEELSGREFVFQIRITPFNFTPNHRTFTVSTMAEESLRENKDGGIALSKNGGETESTDASVSMTDTEKEGLVGPENEALTKDGNDGQRRKRRRV